MPPKPNRRPKGSRKNGLLSIEAKQLAQQRELVQNSNVNLQGTAPSVPDVPRMRLKRDKPFTFTRTAILAPFVADGATIGARALTFSLDQVATPNDITAFFDQYRILQVTVTLTVVYVQQSLPIYSSIDYDDASTPVTTNDIFQKETCQINSGGAAVVQRRLVPRALSEYYVSTVSTGYSTVASPWIDSVNSSIPHYGLKLYSPSLTTAGTRNEWAVTVEYVLQGRNSS